MRIGLSLGGHRSSAPPPVSEVLQAYGTNLTLSERGSDGFYTFTSDNVATNRAIGSVAALTGDLLLEIVPLAAPPSIGFAFHDAPALAGLSVPEGKEVVQTEGGGGGPNWLGAWKNPGGFQGVLPARNGNIYMERVGAAWRIYTGATFAAAKTAGAIYTGTPVDTNARYLAIVAIGVNANIKVRFRPHPGA